MSVKMRPRRLSCEFSAMTGSGKSASEKPRASLVGRLSVWNTSMPARSAARFHALSATY
jgi:hypothetical protein